MSDTDQPPLLPYVAGVIPTARGVLDIIVSQAKRYEDGKLDAVSFDALVERTRRQLDVRACWCNEGVCCQVHNKHVTPHQRCILR